MTSTLSRCVLISLTFLSIILHPSSSISIADQPRAFSSLTEWNQNLFKRVADCIRDTRTVSPTDNVSQRIIRRWAEPLCNQILRILNENWGNNVISNNLLDPNGADTILINQEYHWRQVAITLYGSNIRSQACGVLSLVVYECVYVVP